MCVCVPVQQQDNYVPFPQDCSSYICRNGECIASGTARCDGHVDCTDGSDEAESFCDSKYNQSYSYCLFMASYNNFFAVAKVPATGVVHQSQQWNC